MHYSVLHSTSRLIEASSDSVSMMFMLNIKFPADFETGFVFPYYIDTIKTDQP